MNSRKAATNSAQTDPVRPQIIIKRSLSDTLIRWILVLALALAAYVTYEFFELRLISALHKNRLDLAVGRYRELEQLYNRAVERTAVTELLVEDDKVSVIIRTAVGETQRIETIADPKLEVYVDYIVEDSRLWIRRVFDENTPPGKGTLIDPELGRVTWRPTESHVGKAIYKQLERGRWVVSVTGNGSLGLRRAGAGETVPLQKAPSIDDFAPREDTVLDSSEPPSLRDLVDAVQ